MAFDVILTLTSAAFALLILLGSIYFLVYFQHPDDKFVAWFPKIVVIFGLSIACYNIFLLPLDVANQNGEITALGGLPMEGITFAFFITTICLGIVIVPFVMFYYEGVDDSDSEEDKTTVGGQVVNGLKWTAPTLVILAVIDFLFWQYLSIIKIGYTEIRGNLVPGENYTGPFCNVTNECPATKGISEVRVSILISTVALATVVGWILFAVFGGVGLIALPFDLMMDYKNRPRPIKNDVYVARKKAIGEQATMLLEAIDGIQSKQKEIGKASRSKFNRKARKLREKENQFRNDVLELENLYLVNEESHQNAHGRALFFLVKAVIGFFGSFISFAWYLHIFLYVIPPIFKVRSITPFLNDFLTAISGVPFLGVSFYAIFSFWLLLCTIKGNTKLGMRVLFMSIHPMKIGETMMSSFIFNVGLIMLSSLAVAQFSTMAFDQYARYTTSQTLFVATIRNLENLRIFYDVMIFVLLGFSIFSMAWCVYRPPAGNPAELAKRRKRLIAGVK